jgi:hypothetical protein
MENDALVRAIVDHCMAFEISAAVIVANLCSDCRENVDRILGWVSLRDIGEVLIDGKVEVQIKCAFAAIFASVCLFPLGVEEANVILNCISDCMDLYAHETGLMDELFLVVARVRMHSENALQLFWDNGLLTCVNLLRTELSSSSVITILECYGEAVQDEFPVGPLDLSVLITFIRDGDLRVADAAVWLLWTCMDRQNHAELLDPEFAKVLLQTGTLGNLSMLKHSLLIWARLISECSRGEVSHFVTYGFVEMACGVLADETDDVEVQLELIGAVIRLLHLDDDDIVCLVRENAAQSGLLQSLECREAAADHLALAFEQLRIVL